MVIIGGSSSGRQNKPTIDPEHKFSLNATFGINTTPGDNAILLESEEGTSAILPVGHQVISVNVLDRSTECLATLTNSEISCLSLAPDKKHIAISSVAEGGTENQVFVLQHGSKMPAKALHIKSAAPIKSASFSDDSMLVAVASSDGVELWDWKAEKLVAKGGITESQDVSRVRCSKLPIESELPIVTTSGQRHMRIWSISAKDRMSNKSIMASPKEEQEMMFVDHIWVKSTLAAVITSKTGNSSIIVFTLSQSKSPRLHQTAIIPISTIEASTTINCIVQVQEGFAVAGSHGFLGLFQPDNTTSDDSVAYSQIHSTCTRIQDDFKCASCNGEKVLLSTKNSLYTCSWDSLVDNKSTDSLVELFGFHEGAIVASSLATALPLLATAGTDNSVRVWDLVKNKCVAAKQFEEEIRDVSIHPSAKQLLICFKDLVSMYMIVNSGIKKLIDIPGKDCRKASFSTGGQYFAIAIGRKLSLYQTWNPYVKARHVFNYHTSPITSIQWGLTDDEHLFSSARDELYAWNLRTAKRVEGFDLQNVLSGSNIVDFSIQSMANDGKDYQAFLLVGGSVSAVTSVGGNPTTRTIHSNACRIHYSGSLLLIGDTNGSVHAMDANDEYKIQANLRWDSNGSAVTCLCSNGELVSCHNNGNVYISSRACDTYLHNYIRDGSSTAALREVVLVCSKEFRRKQIEVESAKQELDQMKSDYDLRIYRQGKELKEEISRVQMEKANIEEQFLDSVSRHDADMKIVEEDCSTKLQKLALEHSGQVRKLENMYDDRLMKSTQNMDALKQQLQHATQSHQEEVKSISAQHEALIAKLHHECRVEVDKLNKDVARMSEEVARTEHMRQEMLSQQAEEYEKELAQQAAESLQTLLKRQSMIDSTSTQVQTLKSKLEQQNRMNKDMRSKINFHQNENADMTNKHKSLEEEIKRLRKVITDKDVQLKKAVEEMEEMKFHQAVLEKELYVTKTNMSELLRDRKPLEVSLQEEKKANESLQEQLQQAKSDNASLRRASDLQVSSIRSKAKEILALKNTARGSIRRLTSLEGEIVHLSSISNDKLLQIEVKNTYQKYVKSALPDEVNPVSPSAQEASVTHAKEGPHFQQRRTCLTDSKATIELKSVRESLSKRMSENTILMEDCNVLRKQNLELKSEMAR